MDFSAKAVEAYQQFAALGHAERKKYCQALQAGAVVVGVVVLAATVSAVASGSFFGACVGGLVMLGMYDAYKIVGNFGTMKAKVLQDIDNWIGSDVGLNAVIKDTLVARSVVPLFVN